VGWSLFGAGDMVRFGLGHLLWWALLVAATILLVRWLVRGARPAKGADPGRALSILKQRYARGEIDPAEFEARRRDIA